MGPVCATSGPGGEGKAKTLSPVSPISGTPWLASRSWSPMKEEVLAQILDVRGRFDYVPFEFVFVAFQSEQNTEILEFGNIQEIQGDHYLVRLITKNNEMAVVTRASLRIAGIA